MKKLIFLFLIIVCASCTHYSFYSPTIYDIVELDSTKMNTKEITYWKNVIDKQ